MKLRWWIIILISILGIALVIMAKLLFFAKDSPMYPSDDVLNNVFRQHGEEFNKLITMSEADSKVVRIAPDFTWLENNFSWPRSDSELGFSQERWNEYRQLFNKLEIKDGLIRPLDADIVFLSVYSWGMVTGGSSKGYAYSPNELAPLSSSLDKIPSNLTNESIVYKSIGHHWYLYLRND